MTTKSKKVPKKHVSKSTFKPVHEVCPELVNLFDYMIDQTRNGSQEVQLRTVELYVENMSETLGELIDLFGHDAVLAQFEHLQEIHDFSS